MPTLPALVSMGHRKTLQPLWILGLTSVVALALCGCSNSGTTAAKTDAPGGGGGGSGKGGGRRGGGDVPVTVASAQAAIGASTATAENAKVQLGYTTIYSPINGRTGNLTVKQGNVVTANNMDMMTINQVEPIYVTFSVPESQLTAIKKYMALGSLTVRTRPQDADVADEERGALTFVDNTVDVTTGTIKLKGTFPNAGHKLWPGQFVRVTLRLTTQQNAVVVPNEAIQTGQTGSFVYVVKQDKTVESRTVVTGARVEQDMVVSEGLTVGETVVTEGQLRLAPGSKVVVRDG